MRYLSINLPPPLKCFLIKKSVFYYLRYCKNPLILILQEDLRFVFNPNASFKLLKENYFLLESTRPAAKEMIDVTVELSLLISLIAFKLTWSLNDGIKYQVKSGK